MGRNKLNSMKKALDGVSDNIFRLVGELKDNSGDIDSLKLKQLKELTIAAKELSSLIRTMCEQTDSSSAKVSISFESEGEEWAE